MDDVPARFQQVVERRPHVRVIVEHRNDRSPDKTSAPRSGLRLPSLRPHISHAKVDLSVTVGNSCLGLYVGLAGPGSRAPRSF